MNKSHRNLATPHALKLQIIIATALLFLMSQPVYASEEQKVSDADFVEQTVQIGDVTLNYVEGPDNGPPLLLLHAQHMEWLSYSHVLHELSISFHVFAVDYHGHGKTISPVERYNAEDIGSDLAVFIETVIGEPAFVSGNSSGGLLTVWLAVNRPDLVTAIVLEDPPLFTAEYPRVQETISYRSFVTCHMYIEAGDEGDFLTYWLESNKNFVANNAGEAALPLLLTYIESYRSEYPNEPLEFPFLPDLVATFFQGMDHYDPYFGDAFYDGRWNQEFDHAEALQNITQPTLLLHANYEILDDGTLNGALSPEDADHILSLLPNGEYMRVDSAHTIHLDKPDLFISIIEDFFLEIEHSSSTHSE